MTAPGPGWRRLDARMLAVFPIRQALPLVPVLLVVLVGGRGQASWQLTVGVAGPAAVVMIGVLRWLTVRYRVGVERVELRSGLLDRKHRSLRRDRIRTVDLTAGPVHRVFGLSVVEIGTGSGAGAEGRLRLDAVTVREGERLRRQLLDRSPVAAPDPSAPDPSAPTAEPLARLRPSWLRFAPLTGSGLAALGAVTGTATQFADDLGLDLGAVYRAGYRLGITSVGLSVLAVAAAVLVVGALGALVIYVESWWGYRLTREPDATLRLRRGLLTTRSLSIEQDRMRGAEVSQSLPLRVFGGARCAAITTGLDTAASLRGALLPPAPLAEAHRVAAAALLVGDPAEITAATLRRHGPAALRRRLTRVLAPAAVVVTAGSASPVTTAATVWPAATLVLAVATLLGIDRYRNLGHALGAEYLVIGRGSLIRRRVALQRRGIIGWRLRQGVFQRRAGLVTLDAVTAAGQGRYSLADLPMAWAIRLVDEVDPGLLLPSDAPASPAATRLSG